MNVSNNGQRLRGPNGAPAARPIQDHRNINNMSSTSATSTQADRNPQSSQMSRAERFEDEKKRIIESCFGRKDADGTISESYITHIKVEEDAAYPSSPPPLESTNKKERVIVVAVRKSGRVRMHKARENQNGTFSIGKTWVLDDLTMIESFTHSIPQTAEEQQNKQRACSTGFLVTIQKPYYWTANTAKEKDFFILSLIKIYKKYTGGRLPELIGFSSSELNQLGAPAGPQDVPQPILPQPNGSRAVSSRVPSQDPPAIRGPPPETSRERRPRQPQKRPSEERQLHSAVYQNWSARGAGSSERVHMPGSFPSTDSIHDPSPHSSQPQLRSKRSESPALHSTGVQQPNFRRLGPSQSTDSFQSGRETQQPQTTSSRRPSNERPGQIGTYPTVLRPGIAGQQHSDDRPVTAVRDVAKSPYSAVDSPYSTSDSPPYAITDSPSYPGQGQTAATQAQTLDFNPRSNERLEERSREQIMPRSVQDTRNGDRRDLSASGRDPSRGARGPPSLNPSEHSAEPFPEETPPTTASSQGVESSPIRSQEVTSHSPTDREDGASTPQDPVLKQPPTLPPETQIEAHRPGLGPMIKKKSTTNVASKFRKAATTYNAFRPGATPVDETKDDKPAGGDGITGVFQAPSLAKGVSQDNVRPSTPKQNLENRPATPNLKKDVPTVQVTSSPPKPSISIVPTNPVTQVPPEITVQRNNEPENPEPPIVDRAPEDRRKKRRSDHSAKYAKALGISPNLVEGRTSEIEEVLNDFGWGEESNNRSTCEELETGIRKELARVEAGSWLGAVDNNDDRVAAINEMMDKVIAECDELDGLLTLYNVELGTLSEDVAYIEAQSQGLQVQTANQKLLQSELKNLLDTISISASELQVLKDASLTKTRGIQEVEYTLAQLYAALLTIDPKMRQHDTRLLTAGQANLHRSSNIGHGSSELSSMHAVCEKKERYRMESVDFIGRLKQYMSVKFRETEAETFDALERNRRIRTSNPTKLDHRLRDDPKKDLWLYSPLMLFAREIEQAEWEDLLRMYEGCAKKPYQDEFSDNFSAWKRITKKSTGDEQDVLFTTHEKEAESLVGRKLTVKRSKTVRADGSSRISSGDKPKDGKVTAYEAFAGGLTETARIIFVEQNFVTDVFHAFSLDTQDFIDATVIEPEKRGAVDPMIKKPFDPDRKIAKIVLGVMEEIYAFWPTELQSLADWAIKQDSLNCVGVLFALESQLIEIEETNQEFLSQVVTKVHDRLATHFTRFVEEQIRGIEDTKVKTKKRKGVIAFMKTFPNFSIALENMLPPTRSLNHLPVRAMVNDAYSQINKAMFESLKFIAKENPNEMQAQAATTVGDPEDKEALNYHILLIENMNHYIEEVVARNNPVLEDWNFRARAEMSEHMELYLAAVIRRPLGKLLDILESTESLMRNNPGSAASIAIRASHSRSTFKKIVSSYDGKEIRRGIDTLKRRVDKHFGEGDDTPGLSGELVLKVLRECESKYLEVSERVNKIVRDVYEGSLEVEFRKEDVVAAFRR